MEFFDPVDYSVEELKFLFEHLGEPSIVALQGIKAVPLVDPPRGKDGKIRDKAPFNYPDGVNPNAVKPVLDKVNELQDLEVHRGERWCGLEAVKAAIQVFLDQNAQWERDTKRGAPRWPSLYSFDSGGRPHLSGPGSDSGKVRTYFGEDGKRQEFRIPFVPQDLAEGNPDWAKRATPVDVPTKGSALRVDAENNRIECLVKGCGHTERFNTESRSSYNAARARMSRHLRSAKQETFAHREAHTNEFGS